MAKEKDIIVDDVIEGLNVCISCNIREPQFTSQAKEKISGPDEKQAIYTALVREFRKFLREQPAKNVDIIKEKIRNNAKARKAAEVAKITKKKSIQKNASPANLPSKLKECDFPGDENSELYICLTGDTKIRMADGSSRRIDELVGENNLEIYSFNGEKPIITKMKSAFKTREATKMIRITMEDGSVVECTPEHRFLVRGKWVEAQNLTIDDSIDTI